MGKRGPAPKPTELKILEGTYRADRAARNEPKPRVKIPSCPAWLQGEGRKEYFRVARLLMELRVITDADRTALAAYAQQYQRWIDAEDMIRKSGILIKSPNGFLMQNPCLPIANTALKNMQRLMSEFGLTPASRTRISAEPDDSQPKSLAEQLFELAKND
jgi:P27 family predicted phage terminase small subunit